MTKVNGVTGGALAIPDFLIYEHNADTVTFKESNLSANTRLDPVDAISFSFDGAAIKERKHCTLGMEDRNVALNAE